MVIRRYKAAIGWAGNDTNSFLDLRAPGILRGPADGHPLGALEEHLVRIRDLACPTAPARAVHPDVLPGLLQKVQLHSLCDPLVGRDKRRHLRGDEDACYVGLNVIPVFRCIGPIRRLLHHGVPKIKRVDRRIVEDTLSGILLNNPRIADNN